jgi:hypothetical protein
MAAENIRDLQWSLLALAYFCHSVADSGGRRSNADSGRPPVPRAIIALILLLVSHEAARADLRIVSSAGGEVGSYLRLFAAVRQSGQRRPRCL